MIKVYIDNSPVVASKRIFIVDEDNKRRFVAKPMKLEFVELKEDVSTEPTIDIPYRYADGFLQALLVAIKDQGIKLPEQSFTEGKLQATEKHLEDMRTLVFEDQKIINVENRSCRAIAKN